MKEERKHTRTQFQIDRIAFFSDAVIAIAITLMVLEIKIPEIGKSITFNQFLEKYSSSLILHIIALLIGFITIGSIWMRHHELFEHIINYNKKLTKINLYFLFSVTLLPISISFLFTENEPLLLPRFCYFTNLLLVNFLFYLMVALIFNKKYNFSGIKDIVEIKKIKIFSLIDVLIFLIVILISIISINGVLPTLPFIIAGIIKHILNKKWKAKNISMGLFFYLNVYLLTC
jgi:uncharacterized membrane protein